MKRNPSKPKAQNKPVNVSSIFETLSFGESRTKLANYDYAQCLKRTWKDFDTGNQRAV